MKLQIFFRDSYQVLSVLSHIEGEHKIKCRANQDFYQHEAHSITILVKKEAEPGDDETSGLSLHNYFLLLIILASVFLTIIAVMLLVTLLAFFTGTICFTDKKSSQNNRKVGAKYEHGVGVVDTNYVVGQDYHPNQ